MVCLRKWPKVYMHITVTEYFKEESTKNDAKKISRSDTSNIETGLAAIIESREIYMAFAIFHNCCVFYYEIYWTRTWFPCSAVVLFSLAARDLEMAVRRNNKQHAISWDFLRVVIRRMWINGTRSPWYRFTETNITCLDIFRSYQSMKIKAPHFVDIVRL